MPNGKTHQAAAIPTGALCALIMSEGQSDFARFFETIGGALGGGLGGACPDGIDPPTNSHHRSLAHGVVPAGVGLRWAWSTLQETQFRIRCSANAHGRACAVAETAPLHLWHFSCQVFLHVLAGMIVGFVAGYASHLVLDAFTPRRLPLLS